MNFKMERRNFIISGLGSLAVLSVGSFSRFLSAKEVSSSKNWKRLCGYKG